MKHCVVLAAIGWLGLTATADPPLVVGKSQPVESALTLTPGPANSPLAPRYSPPGRQLKLTPSKRKDIRGFDHLETRVKLGPKSSNDEGHLIVLARSSSGKPYDLLFLDANQSGRLGEAVVVTPKTIRNKLWSSFNATLSVDHAPPGQPPQREDYPISLWAVVDKEGDTPEILRMSRRGFLTGSVQLGTEIFDVVLSDSNNDGVLGQGDWWVLNSRPATKSLDGSRAVGDFAWAGGKAWKLEMEGTNGRRGKVVPFDPGCTEEEDVKRRDRLREDRLAKRADKPVAFRKDVDAALKEADARKAPVFIKFETDWCGPCKQMSALVFTAKDVADAADGLTCVVVDGDARKELTEKHAVKAYPTGVLLDADGKEVARYVGYQSVKETTAFLKRLKK